MMLETKFTDNQEREIESKMKQLQAIKDGTVTPKQLVDLITQKRLAWLRQNRATSKRDLSLPIEAYKLIVYDYMKVDGGLLIEGSKNSVVAECRNFCPYLEACQRLELDTRSVCREILEPPVIAFFQEINPHFHFTRDYDKIRPYHDCCVEFVEVRA